MMQWIWVALGGALGAMARYGMSIKASVFFPSLPIGTFIVNVVGSFLCGFVYILVYQTKLAHEPLRLAVLTGFLGAFTTFSTFSMETVLLFKMGGITHAMLNVAANLLVCLIAVTMGMHLGQWGVKWWSL